MELILRDFEIVVFIFLISLATDVWNAIYKAFLRKPTYRLFNMKPPD